MILSLLQGYVASSTPRGVFVRFLGRLTGMAPISQLSDSFVSDPAGLFTQGQSVRARVVEINENLGRFTLTTKQSLCFSPDATYLESYFASEQKVRTHPHLDDFKRSLVKLFGKFFLLQFVPVFVLRLPSSLGTIRRALEGLILSRGDRLVEDWYPVKQKLSQNESKHCAGRYEKNLQFTKAGAYYC